MFIVTTSRHSDAILPGSNIENDPYHEHEWEWKSFTVEWFDVVVGIDSMSCWWIAVVVGLQVDLEVFCRAYSTGTTTLYRQFSSLLFSLPINLSPWRIICWSTDYCFLTCHHLYPTTDEQALIPRCLGPKELHMIQLFVAGRLASSSGIVRSQVTEGLLPLFLVACDPSQISLSGKEI